MQIRLRESLSSRLDICLGNSHTQNSTVGTGLIYVKNGRKGLL